LRSETEWSKYANGGRKPDNGFTTFIAACDHQVLTDKGHRVCHSFSVRRGIKSIEMAADAPTKVDAERMKAAIELDLRLHRLEPTQSSKQQFLQCSSIILIINSRRLVKAATGTAEEVSEQDCDFVARTGTKDFTWF
jgi:hypothetical protein